MRFSSLTARPVPWKNGGGVTRELAVREENQRLAWRLSLADIEQSGPFSAFPGLARIHCIVEGAGHVLSNSGMRLEARPLQPLSFDGGLSLSSRLRDGPCKAFNVIYDPQQTTAKAGVLSGGPLSAGAGCQVFFVVSGSLQMSGQAAFGPGEGVVAETAASGRISDGGVVIHVSFLPV